MTRRGSGRRGGTTVPAERNPSHGRERYAWWCGVAAVGAVAVAVYANSLANGFVWDDPIIVERQLAVFRSLGDVLITPRGIPQYSPDYYRPTTTVSYLLDSRLGGDDPLAFHASVVLAHALVSILVALLCRSMLPLTAAAERAAVAAGLLFAVHPLHTESVAWAAGRSDVLATGFAVAVLLSLRGARPGPLRVAVSGLCAFAALGAKEVAVALYPLLFLRDAIAGDLRGMRRAVVRYAGVGAALIAYLVLRRITIGDVIGEQPGEQSILASLPVAMWAMGGYIRMLLWPWPLNALIDDVPRGFASLLGLAALAGALAWSLVCWRRGDRAWAFATTWIIVAIAPSLTILWKIPEVPMAERYAYLPSVGLALWFALLLLRGGLTATPVRSLSVVPLLLVAAGAVWVRNPVWRDDVTLWTDTAAKTSVSGMAWRSLGSAYLRAGRYEEAEPLLRRALDFANTSTGAQGIYSNLGTIEMSRRQFAAARTLYERALMHGAEGPDVIFNLGLSIFYAGGQSDAAARAALPHFLRAAEASPHDPDIDAVLVQVYAVLGSDELARRHLQAARDKGLSGATQSALEEFLRGGA